MDSFVRPTVSECPYNMTVGLMVLNAPYGALVLIINRNGAILCVCNLYSHVIILDLFATTKALQSAWPTAVLVIFL